MINDAIVFPVSEELVTTDVQFKTNLLHMLSRRLECSWYHCELPRSEKYQSTVQHALPQYSTDLN